MWLREVSTSANSISSGPLPSAVCLVRRSRYPLSLERFFGCLVVRELSVAGRGCMVTPAQTENRLALACSVCDWYRSLTVHAYPHTHTHRGTPDAGARGVAPPPSILRATLRGLSGVEFESPTVETHQTKFKYKLVRESEKCSGEWGNSQNIIGILIITTNRLFFFVADLLI